MKKLRIGLFGFGVVGEGIYRVLTEKSNLNCEIARVCIKNPEKKRNAPAHLFTTDHASILDDASINVVVELIDDSDAAFQLVKRALTSGKAVVSANKKMIAEHHAELIALQEKHQTSFLYEASVCGSIPILRNLEEYFDNDLLQHVTGIVNGSTNYILTQMCQQDVPFDESLKAAQQNGFAESNPTLDVEGIDAAYKLSIICLHAFGKLVNADSILRKGIGSIKPIDLKFAKEKGLAIKLIASTHNNEEGLSASVLPTFITEGKTLSRVDNEYNGLLIGSTLADEQFLYGKGAGRYPTSSAVLSDISALRYDYKYEFRKGQQRTQPRTDGFGRFYVSFQKNEPIDLGLFDTIEEQYTNHEMAYVVGTIRFSELYASDVWQQQDVSLIAISE
jgi:homoserine dehydrogenase